MREDNLTGAIDPKETVAVSMSLRQVSERCGRTRTGLTANCSAFAAVGLPLNLWQLSGGKPPEGP